MTDLGGSATIFAMPKIPLEAMLGPRADRRFAARMRLDSSGCVIWTGQISKRHGYGRFSYGGRGKKVQAHRWGYERIFGPVPIELDIDHLCRVRACVNVLHLEPVPRRVNLLRGVGFAAVEARRTHCPQGHPYEGDNVVVEAGRYGEKRKCRECKLQRNRDWQRRYAEKHGGKWYVGPKRQAEGY